MHNLSIFYTTEIIVLAAYANCITEFWSWITFACHDGSNLSVLRDMSVLHIINNCFIGFYPGYWVISAICLWWLLCCIPFIPGCENSLNNMTYYGLSTHCDFIRWLLIRSSLKMTLGNGRNVWVAVVCIYDKEERHSRWAMLFLFVFLGVFSVWDILIRRGRSLVN